MLTVAFLFSCTNVERDNPFDSGGVNYNINTTASHYAEYDLSASPTGFEGMIKVYGEFVRWLEDSYFE